MPAFQALSGVANACQILPNVITGGQPNALQLRALKEAGGAVVLDVRDPMESRPVDEPALVKQLGMEYVNIPVRAGSLDDATLDRILVVLRGAGDRTVFFGTKFLYTVPAPSATLLLGAGGLFWARRRR